MLQVILKIIQVASIPALVIASLFSHSAASYELLLDWLICPGAIVFVVGACHSKQYLWAAEGVVLAVVFSPLSLVAKIFLLLGFTCITTLVTLLAAFRAQPVPVD